MSKPDEPKLADLLEVAADFCRDEGQFTAAEQLRTACERVRREVADAKEYAETSTDPWAQNAWGAIRAALSRIGA